MNTTAAIPVDDLTDAFELVQIGAPYRSYPGTGGIWCGRNEGIPQAQFDDWGLARATAIILNAAPALATLRAENARLRTFHDAWVSSEVARATGDPDLVRKLRSDLIAAHKVIREAKP